jgi:hypothetical protein
VWRRRLARGAAAFVALLAAACSGSDRPAGRIEGARRPADVVAHDAAAQEQAASAIATSAGTPRALPGKRILFGDLHVHTTYSIDAFFMSLPITAGEGAHPPADLCDFARYCSQLDFFALTDHAESLTPEHWAAEKESVRQCNALAGDPADPDLVAFTGFEWTQVGRTPEAHFGHKCVLFKDDGEDQVPARPITAQADHGPDLFAGLDQAKRLRWFDPLGYREYADFVWMIDRIGRMERCPKGVDVRRLPPDCQENAETPDVLFEKLAQWGYPVTVIPHGTSWGLYTPPTTSMDKQLTAKFGATQQPLVEIMSGHGNSEEYRWWQEFYVGDDGRKICPEPTPDYLPCCWQAGEIMRRRCGDLPAAECDRRVADAKQAAMDANVAPHLVFPDSRAEDWLDCGQCRDCFKPALGYRPRESVQYSMAISSFDEKDASGAPLRFRYGFVASSDNHKARPGTGYKQYDRREMTESTGVRSAFYDRFTRRQMTALQKDPRVPVRTNEIEGLLGADIERVGSYLYPGGLVAAHSEGRSRDAIWDALQRREVYGTSGPRILLWFDLLNAEGGAKPMGSAVAMGGAPRFEVRAVGSQKQQPGCPETSARGLSPGRLAALCRGECHHPSDERHPIVAIEIVRIRPQAFPGEPVERLIEDPWLHFDCAPDPAGCSVQFEDLEFPGSARDTLYYARAIQEETPAINGRNLRSELDANGNAVKTSPCYGDFRTPFDEDCLAPVRERAWSSPIFVDVVR